MDDWLEIAATLLDTLKEKQAEFARVAQLELDEENEILKETLAQALRDEELAGRIRFGPALR